MRGGETGKESGVGKGGGEMHYSKSKSPGEGYGSPLQYSCKENPMDIRAWWATGHRIAKSQT